MAKTIDLVIKCLKEKKMTQTELAKSLGEDVRIINQQLNRQQDLKAERFLEVMEHIGYRVEMVDNDGIRKVREEMINNIQAGVIKGSMFYAEKDDDKIIGIYSETDMCEVEEFGNKADCFEWLISHTQTAGKFQ